MKKKCLQCGEVLPKGVSICPFCEAPVEAEGEAAPQEGAEPSVHGAAEEEAAPTLEVGDVVEGRYEIQERMGAGPKGVVYRAHDKALDETVALRLVDPAPLRVPEVLTAFKEELTRAQGLRHPNLAQVIHVGRWSGLNYVVTQYIPGETLDRWLGRRGGSVPPSQALSVVGPLAQALRAIHSASPPLVHAGLNPANVMVTPEGAVKLLDLGLAPLLRAPQLRLALESDPRTLPFLAPEQVKGEATTPATDAYSFGALLYYLLTGRAPFSGGDLRWKIMFEEVEVPDDLPDHVREVLLRLLDKDPERRPAPWEAALSLIHI